MTLLSAEDAHVRMCGVMMISLNMVNVHDVENKIWYLVPGSLLI